MKSCILAVADGKAQQVLDQLGLQYVPPGHPDWPQWSLPHLLYERAGVAINCIVRRLAGNVTLPWTSASTSGLWDVFLLVADPGSLGPGAVADDADGQWITRAYRRLRRAADAHPTYLRGPWTPQHLWELYPVKARALLNRYTDEDGNEQVGDEPTFPLLAGARHDAALAWDYRPTQDEIDGDTDWSDGDG